MFAWAGWAVAPDNATQAAKRTADVVSARTNDEDFIAEMLAAAARAAAMGAVISQPSSPVLEPSRSPTEGKIHRIDPDFGSTLTVSNRILSQIAGSTGKLWANPVNFRVREQRAQPEHDHRHRQSRRRRRRR